MRTPRGAEQHHGIDKCLPLHWALVKCAVMQTEREQREKNTLLRAGVMLLVVSVALGFVPFFAQVPGQRALPWVNLLLSVLSVALIVAGLRRATSQPGRHRGNAAGWILTVLSSLLLLFAIFGFHVARSLPPSTAAPQVGQKAPDFELKDNNGQTVTLQQLLAQPADPARQEARPKAVLLVFYRGYW